MPGAKFEARRVKGPAEPFMVKPVDAAPLRKELLRGDDKLMFGLLPLSISDAILDARVEDWLLRCEGVVDDGREGGLNGFF